MNNLYKILCIVSILHGLTACGGMRNPEENMSQTGRIDPDIFLKHDKTRSATEEYVNRVAKRLLSVSDNGSFNYTFQVDESSAAILTLDHSNNSIIIGRGALLQLRDEAELAAVVGLAMSKLDDDPELDQHVATELARAGYAPQALVDLQVRYNNQQLTWLDAIYNTPPGADTLQINQSMIDKMPKGLQRGSETYNKQIGK